MMQFDPAKVRAIFSDAINTLFDVSGRPKEELREYVRQFDAMRLGGQYEPMVVAPEWAQLPCFPDVPKGVAMLQKPTFILSNVPTDAIVRSVYHAGISCLGVISAVERVKRYKPDPEVYRWAAHHCGLNPEDCLMVTANPRIGGYDHGDVEAARSVGMQACLIRGESDIRDVIHLAEILGC